MDNNCVCCGAYFPPRRYELGFRTCLACGEAEARQVKHTVAPMAKSNYILITDPELLKMLNKLSSQN